MITYPLLQSQLGVLLQNMQHPESTQYNLPNYIFMPLTMKMERVASAMRTLLQSVPELHTRFVTGEQGEIRQWCDRGMNIPVTTRKCSETELQAYISNGFVRPFDLFGSEPLFRAEVIETEERLCLLSDGHHAIVDGMSFAPILTSAFARIFEGGSIEQQPYGMYQAAEDEIKAYAQLAQKLGASYIRILADLNPDPADDVDDDYIVEALKKLVPVAEEYNVTLLVETNGVYSDTARLAKVLDGVKSRKVAALWDMHHPYRYNNEAPETTVANLGEYIKYIHQL